MRACLFISQPTPSARTDGVFKPAQPLIGRVGKNIKIFDRKEPDCRLLIG
jgi:hypothetical protein